MLKRAIESPNFNKKVHLFTYNVEEEGKNKEESKDYTFDE